MKKFLSLAAAIVVLIVMAVAGVYISKQSPDRPVPVIGFTTTAASPVKAVVPIDLSGDWNTSPSETLKMAAHITADTITVEFISNKNEYIAYWYGTFEQNKVKIVSQAKEDKFFLAKATSKDFLFKDGKLSFEVTVMGVTKRVEMTRA